MSLLQLSTTRQRRIELAEWLRPRESCGIREFANCLAGLLPDEEWVPVRHGGQRAAKEFAEVLGSCAHVSLKPVNPNAAPESLRFQVRDLLKVSVEKYLGYAVDLAALLKVSNKQVSTRERDVEKFIEWVQSRLTDLKIHQLDFCERGCLAAVYDFFCKRFPKAGKPYSEDYFARLLNAAGFKFGSGARGEEPHEFVRSTLGDPPPTAT